MTRILALLLLTACYPPNVCFHDEQEVDNGCVCDTGRHHVFDRCVLDVAPNAVVFPTSHRFTADDELTLVANDDAYEIRWTMDGTIPGESPTTLRAFDYATLVNLRRSFVLNYVVVSEFGEWGQVHQVKMEFLP